MSTVSCAWNRQKTVGCQLESRARWQQAESWLRFSVPITCASALDFCLAFFFLRASHSLELPFDENKTKINSILNFFFNVWRKWNRHKIGALESVLGFVLSENVVKKNFVVFFSPKSEAIQENLLKICYVASSQHNSPSHLINFQLSHNAATMIHINELQPEVRLRKSLKPMLWMKIITFNIYSCFCSKDKLTLNNVLLIPLVLVCTSLGEAQIGFLKSECFFFSRDFVQTRWANRTDNRMQRDSGGGSINVGKCSRSQDAPSLHPKSGALIDESWLNLCNFLAAVPSSHENFIQGISGRRRLLINIKALISTYLIPFAF